MTTNRRSSAAAAAAAGATGTDTTCVRRASTRVSAMKAAKASAQSEKAPEKKTTAKDTVSKASTRVLKRSREQEQPGTAPVVETDNQGTGKRTRGRPRKSTAAVESTAQEEAAQATAQQPSSSEQDPPRDPPAKRSRKSGRRSKADALAAAATAAAAAAAADPTSEYQTAEPTEPTRAMVDASPPSNAEPTDAAAQAAHQLQPQAQHQAPDPEPSLAAPPQHQPQQPLPQAPRSPAAAVVQPLQVSSPQRRVLIATNAALASTAPQLGPAAAPRSPKTQTQMTEVAAPTRPDGGLTEPEIVQIRRLLMPGALAGTLMSCAAAAGASAPTVPNDVAGDGRVATEPAGRTAQFKELYGMVSECCSTGRGSAVYISGLPGTGKTYTVSRLLAALPALATSQSESSSSAGGGGVSFCCATLNCMAIDDPAQLYDRLQNELLRAAASESVKRDGTSADAPEPPSHSDAGAALASLLDTLHKLSVVRPRANEAAGKATAKAKGVKRGRGGGGAVTGGAAEEGAPRRRVFVVVLDEVDRLLRRRDGGEELAQLFQLPATPGVYVVLLAVANSLDLTERMMPQLRARGVAPRHMVFTAYSRPQVLAILSAQLSAHHRGRRCFDDAALDMVAKSVSSSSGDLRQALKACRTALDVLTDHNRANPAAARASVGIREVHAALQRISSQGNGQSAVVAKIKSLPPQQQLVLLALATAVGARAATAGAEGPQGGGFQPGGALFTGSRPKFMDAVAFREIGNQVAAVNNPGACFDGPTPSKAGRPGAAAPAATPSTSHVRGITGPGGGGGTPGSCSRGPPSRTPASILAGDAGLALGLADVYTQYGALCRQLDIPAMSESAFRTDALPGLNCDGLLRVVEGRTPAATRLSLRVMVRDVQAALADNVMFKRLMGAKAPAPGAGAGLAGVPGVPSGAVGAAVGLARA